MRPIDRLFEAYGESHQHPTNKLFHWLCIPVILFSVVGALWAIPHAYFDRLAPAWLQGWINWGSLFIAGVLLYYLRLSFTLFLGFLLIGSGLVAGNHMLHQWGTGFHFLVSAILFALGWVGQFIGHHIEGKRPSFFKDLQFLLVGPAWLLHFIYKKTGIPY